MMKSRGQYGIVELTKLLVRMGSLSVSIGDFGNKIPMKTVFFDDVTTKSYNWCRYRCNASFSMDEWLKNPYLISL